ncbi:LEAF RUST 10 DISEASE-RESISTANCE LOCUS RECEPTOR-LIKE PROTEIN KINASE-like 2.3 [Tasmannia lanceolata]|uniref:LEAF RUST 10 DISEASE-RESISTANCE LOCUS RECEPTOR-LIKE PROTEIN KINASE-like 2.3 n=1 Tax=Tasmannia lanceolata TaxID=3420 RepID=UPI004063D293
MAVTSLGSAIKSGVKHLNRTVRYVYNYNNYVGDLMKEYENLKLVRVDVQGIVDAASRRGEVVPDSVKLKRDINDLCRDSNFPMISYSRRPNHVQYEQIDFLPGSNRIESSNTLNPICDEIIEEKFKIFSSEKLKSITDNFKKKLGQSGFGVVYEGILEDGMHVAVKVVNAGVSDSLIKKQFKAEANSIGRTNHFNLVRLCGFCFEEELKALVLSFKGTPGYAALEMWQQNPSRITHKCDVYSFGILLFEIGAKRRHFDEKALPGQEQLPIWIWEKFEERALGETLLGFGIDKKFKKEAERMAMVALWCVQQQPEVRPRQDVGR